MKPDTMTLTELRDWHRHDERWIPPGTPIAELEGRHFRSWVRLIGDTWDFMVQDPFPTTLDGAASAMPAHHWWNRYLDFVGGSLWAAGPNGCRVTAKVPDTGDEITDRYRLAMKAKLAEKESPDGN